MTVTATTPRLITRFSGDYHFLSNFYQAPIPFRLVNGEEVLILTVEHGFQMAKTLSVQEQLAIMRYATPSQAKQRGRQVRLRWDWEMVKENIMLDLLRTKFQRHPDLANKLLGTGNAVLIEGNDWNDRYWGAVWVRGYGWNGVNVLGNLLMQVRRELRGRR